jgi:PKHD-type hydroxylase
VFAVIHHIPNVLSKEQVAEFRKLMKEANWVGGKVTAGTLSASVKRNQQLSEQDPLTHHLRPLPYLTKLFHHFLIVMMNMKALVSM